MSKAAFMLVIGEPLNDLQKTLILQRISNELQTWDDDESHCQLQKELENLATEKMPLLGANAGCVITHNSESLSTVIVSCPDRKQLLDSLQNFLLLDSHYRLLLHAGPTIAGSGSWILQDDIFSFRDFVKVLKEMDSVGAGGNSRGFALYVNSFSDWEWNKNNFSRLSNLGVRLASSGKFQEGNCNFDQFCGFLNHLVAVTDIRDLLKPSSTVGTINFSGPTLYIFPSGSGNSALFGVKGFTGLIDGGSSRNSCFWDFSRHLNQIDMLIQTHLGSSNFLGMKSFLERKAETATPEVGAVFFNCPEKVRKNHGSENLQVNLFQTGSWIAETLNNLDLPPQSCFASQPSQPITLYNKVGFGSVDMYVLNPLQHTEEIKNFFHIWNTKAESECFSTSSGVPIGNNLSISVLLVWKPFSQSGKIVRILFPGGTSQGKVFEGLDRLKNIAMFEHLECSQLTFEKCPVAGAKSKTVPGRMTNLKPTGPKANLEEVAKVKIAGDTKESLALKVKTVVPEAKETATTRELGFSKASATAKQTKVEPKKVDASVASSTPTSKMDSKLTTKPSSPTKSAKATVHKAEVPSPKGRPLKVSQPETLKQTKLSRRSDEVKIADTVKQTQVGKYAKEMKTMKQSEVVKQSKAAMVPEARKQPGMPKQSKITKDADKKALKQADVIKEQQELEKQDFEKDLFPPALIEEKAEKPSTELDDRVTEAECISVTQNVATVLCPGTTSPISLNENVGNGITGARVDYDLASPEDVAQMSQEDEDSFIEELPTEMEPGYDDQKHHEFQKNIEDAHDVVKSSEGKDVESDEIHEEVLKGHRLIGDQMIVSEHEILGKCESDEQEFPKNNVRVEVHDNHSHDSTENMMLEDREEVIYRQEEVVDQEVDQETEINHEITEDHEVLTNIDLETTEDLNGIEDERDLEQREDDRDVQNEIIADEVQVPENLEHQVVESNDEITRANISECFDFVRSQNAEELDTNEHNEMMDSLEMEEYLCGDEKHEITSDELVTREVKDSVVSQDSIPVVSQGNIVYEKEEEEEEEDELEAVPEEEEAEEEEAGNLDDVLLKEEHDGVVETETEEKAEMNGKIDEQALVISLKGVEISQGLAMKDEDHQFDGNEPLDTTNLLVDELPHVELVCEIPTTEADLSKEQEVTDEEKMGFDERVVDMIHDLPPCEVHKHTSELDEEEATSDYKQPEGKDEEVVSEEEEGENVFGIEELEQTFEKKEENVIDNLTCVMKKDTAFENLAAICANATEQEVNVFESCLPDGVLSAQTHIVGPLPDLVASFGTAENLDKVEPNLLEEEFSTSQEAAESEFCHLEELGMAEVKRPQETMESQELDETFDMTSGIETGCLLGISQGKPQDVTLDPIDSDKEIEMEENPLNSNEKEEPEERYDCHRYDIPAGVETRHVFGVSEGSPREIPSACFTSEEKDEFFPWNGSVKVDVKNENGQPFEATNTFDVKLEKQKYEDSFSQKQEEVADVLDNMVDLIACDQAYSGRQEKLSFSKDRTETDFMFDIEHFGCVPLEKEEVHTVFANNSSEAVFQPVEPKKNYGEDSGESDLEQDVGLEACDPHGDENNVPEDACRLDEGFEESNLEECSSNFIELCQEIKDGESTSSETHNASYSPVTLGSEHAPVREDSRDVVIGQDEHVASRLLQSMFETDGETFGKAASWNPFMVMSSGEVGVEDDEDEEVEKEEDKLLEGEKEDGVGLSREPKTCILDEDIVGEIKPNDELLVDLEANLGVEEAEHEDFAMKCVPTSDSSNNDTVTDLLQDLDQVMTEVPLRGELVTEQLKCKYASDDEMAENLEEQEHELLELKNKTYQFEKSSEENEATFLYSNIQTEEILTGTASADNILFAENVTDMEKDINQNLDVDRENDQEDTSDLEKLSDKSNISEDADSPSFGGELQEVVDVLDSDEEPDPVKAWGHPMGLPAPAQDSARNRAKTKVNHDTGAANITLPVVISDKKVPEKNADRSFVVSQKKQESKKIGTSAAPKPSVTAASQIGLKESGELKENESVIKDLKEAKTMISKKQINTGATKSKKAAGSTVDGSMKSRPAKPVIPFYVDLTYIPGNGDSSYVDVEFFRRVRARYYVLSSVEPDPKILQFLVEGKQTWEDKDSVVSVIPTYDSAVFHRWNHDNAKLMEELKISILPAANKCTIKLQDHDDGCLAFRIEF